MTDCRRSHIAIIRWWRVSSTLVAVLLGAISCSALAPPHQDRQHTSLSPLPDAAHKESFASWNNQSLFPAADGARNANYHTLSLGLGGHVLLPNEGGEPSLSPHRPRSMKERPLRNMAYHKHRHTSQLLEELREYDYTPVIEKTARLFEDLAQATHPHTRLLEFSSFGKTFDIHLKKNRDFIAADYKSTVQLADGSLDILDFDHDEDHCWYHGRVVDDPDSHVAVSTCNGLKGLISAHDEVLFIEPGSHHVFDSDEEKVSLLSSKYGGAYGRGKLSDHHVVYRMKDMMSTLPSPTCGVGATGSHAHDLMEDGDEEVDPALVGADGGGGSGSSYLDILRKGVKSMIPLPEPSTHEDRHIDMLQQKETLFVELLVFNDEFRCAQSGGAANSEGCVTNRVNRQHMETSSLDIANIVSGLYRGETSFDYNVQVVLVHQWTLASDPWAITIPINAELGGYDVADLLDQFSRWRSTSLVNGAIPEHDNGQLFSGRDFQGTVVGFASVGVMCADKGKSNGINQMTFPEGYNAAVVTHEMGHNFGMYHDGVEDNTGRINSCSPRGDIMAASGSAGGTPANKFSQCSADYFNQYFDRIRPVCLQNVPVTVYGDPICGNGLTEAGEQCDCGLTSCDLSGDPCCVADVCLLSVTSACSNLEACCEDCQFIAAGTTCREESTECDIEPEVCSGMSGQCPQNFFMNTGETCPGGLCFREDCIPYTGSCDANTDVSSERCGCGNRADGTPCGISTNGTAVTTFQCFDDICYPSESLAEFRWSATIFSPCNQTCQENPGDIGIQSREVFCAYENGTHVGDDFCADVGDDDNEVRDTPPEQQFCNMFECDVCLGQACNNQGTCVESRNGTCNCAGGYGGDFCDIEPSLVISSRQSTSVAIGSQVNISWATTGNVGEIVLVYKAPGDSWGRYLTLPPNAYATLQTEENYVFYVDPDIFEPQVFYDVDVVFLQDLEDTFRFRADCNERGCGDNGMCVSGVCVCDAGFSGPLCEEDACTTLPCHHLHGNCTAGECTCEQGFVQDACDFPTMADPPCVLNGRDCGGGYIESCTGLSGMPSELICNCSLVAPWGGEFCDECSLSCSDNGAPDEDCTKCVCNAGFGGPQCQWGQSDLIQIGLIYRVFDISDSNRELFDIVTAQDLAFALRVSQDRIQVTDVESRGDNGVIVTFRLYLLPGETANGFARELRRQGSDNFRSTLVYRGQITRAWDPAFDPSTPDDGEVEWVMIAIAAGGALIGCIILSLCYRQCCMVDKKKERRKAEQRAARRRAQARKRQSRSQAPSKHEAAPRAVDPNQHIRAYAHDGKEYAVMNGRRDTLGDLPPSNLRSSSQQYPRLGPNQRDKNLHAASVSYNHRGGGGGGHRPHNAKGSKLRSVSANYSSHVEMRGGRRGSGGDIGGRFEGSRSRRRRSHSPSHSRRNNRSRKASTSAAVENWTCDRCTFENNGVMPRCEMCEAPRSRKKKEAEAAAAVVVQVSDPVEDELGAPPPYDEGDDPVRRSSPSGPAAKSGEPLREKLSLQVANSSNHHEPLSSAPASRRASVSVREKQKHHRRKRSSEKSRSVAVAVSADKRDSVSSAVSGRSRSASKSKRPSFSQKSKSSSGSGSAGEMKVPPALASPSRRQHMNGGGRHKPKSSNSLANAEAAVALASANSDSFIETIAIASQESESEYESDSKEEAAASKKEATEPSRKDHRRRPSFDRRDSDGLPLPKGWVRFVNEQGIPYYYNAIMCETKWERPE